ncbi:hypothetical protein N7491_004297 [Penicillium cf. griseofulvum]|uniref:Uncharacterized protein n=1 Tax=Penicillium cf. griseofulvum TaxID=2972120 RepID=A0A9W9M3M8_9EURO|nr:hypothetical protein N7472_006989 [Penicillium cf. griseofulvum]KAJ5423078.1 hypothetical protein N7445_011186 [Penicillium cf. griseofulvum]KAJ5433702.1 hypothetical protein N7491_004297 [Penicillium cf. griseofulvum]
MENTREILAGVISLASWRNLALFLAVINLKSLPFVWHFRLLYHFFGNLRLKPSAPLLPKGRVIVDSRGNPTHPIFVPCMITSRTPLLETDYNLHKSNSTYFTDLDVSRTALVSRIYSPGVGNVSKELDQEFLVASKKEGKPAPRRKPVLIVLGSVYCTFKREIKPFELYEMHSKVLSWDAKWLYVLTCFMRPARRSGDEKVILAVGVSKYVVKKGRLTVPPERILRASGFLPTPPPESEAKTTLADVDSSAEASGVDTPGIGEGITATGGIDGSLVREVLKMNDDHIPGQEVLDKQQKENTDSWNVEEWTWERIEQERLRGLEIVNGYTNMDAKLFDEWVQ